MQTLALWAAAAAILVAVGALSMALFRRRRRARQGEADAAAVEQVAAPPAQPMPAEPVPVQPMPVHTMPAQPVAPPPPQLGGDTVRSEAAAAPPQPSQSPDDLVRGLLHGLLSTRDLGHGNAALDAHVDRVLRQAEAHPPLDPSPLVAGLITAHDLAAGNLAVSQRVEAVLAGAGIRRLDAAPGTPFDTDLHECVDTEPGSTFGMAEPGGPAAPVVTRQVRPGWASEQKMLRPVEVVVAVG